MQIDFLKYYFIMILQYLILSVYVYVRIMVSKPHSSILSTYDCFFYALTSTLIMTAFYYIFTTAFNIIYEEKDKAVNILQSWRQMMSISPIGTIIITNTSILFINDVATSILKSNSVKIESNSIIYFITETEKLSENETNRTIKTPNSHYIYCDLKSIVFEERNASIIILNDITKVINWQNQRHEQEMVEMLVATSTHEMRTPLHCIKNTLQMLQDERSQPNEFISRAITACDMQECYINDMLDFAKFKKDTLVIVKEHICVNELLNEVGGYFTYTAKENNIYLNVEMPTDSIIISADYTRLKQILFNLISNAFKFTQSGGITLVASLVKSMVIIEVKDTGVGIRPDDLKHLFEAFGVIESTRKYNKSGTGLGLFLCKQLCALMGAGISVESKIDIGSTFSLTFDQLPLNTNLSPKLKASSSMNSHSTNKLTKVHAKGRALVVDDNGFNCRILEKMLELQSVASYRALNGQFALDLLHSKGDIAIAFVDLNMPIMDGFELMKIIKNTHTIKDRFPIYALTGDATDETKKKCETYGFNGCLIKPFTKDKLKELLIQNSIL
jgi:signal transduction histidine kinase